MIRCAIPTNTGLRMSSESVWPLRRADGTRWCDPALPKPNNAKVEAIQSRIVK